MKTNLINLRVEIQSTQICVKLPGQPDLTFSADLPARRQLRAPGYSEKGWLWCAFQEALEKANVKLAHPFEVFETIWRAMRMC
jgi:hypothetical protein